MAIHTVVQDGNWHSPHTWDLSSIPGRGDSVVIGYHVYVDQDTEVGEYSLETTIAVYMVDGGWLEVDGNVTFTVLGSVEPLVPAVDEDDDMIDFEDIGGVYDDSGAAVANSAVLRAYFTDNSGSGGIELKFSGEKNPTYNNRRIGQSCYLDLSAGPISNVTTTTEYDDLILAGAAGSVIIGTNPVSLTTPVFKIYREAGKPQAITIKDLEIWNPLGSGLEMAGTVATTGPGQSCRIYRCQFRYCGTSLTSPHPDIDYDGWTDIEPDVIVPYGVFFEDADGMMLRDVAFKDINGHGMVVKRWNRGFCHSSARDCEGSGLKAERVQSTNLDVVNEACRGYGVHIRDCGQHSWSTLDSVHGGSGGPNLWRLWTEGNNAQLAEYQAYQCSPGSGYSWRQTKIESSSGLEIIGHSGWQDNKVHLTEAVRRSNIFIDRRAIDPSADGTNALLLYDLNNDGINDPTNPTYSNFATAWPTPGDRATMASTGSTGGGDYEAQLTVVADSYDNATASAWWKLSSAFTIDAGSMLYWTAEISGDQDAADHCIAREAQAGVERMPAWLGSLDIWGPSEGKSNLALWNTAKRKFCGRIFMDDSRTAALIFYVRFYGMHDVKGYGTTWPLTNLQINLHSIKFYEIKAN